MKNKHSLFLIMAVLVTIFEVVAYGYMYRMVGVSLEHAVKSQTSADVLAMNKEREKSFLEAYKSTATKWSSLPQFFVDSSRVVDFIEAVESLSAISGSKVTIMTIDADNLDGAPVGKEGVIRTRIDVEGTWPAVMRDLSLAEALPYKISINNVRADSPKKSLWDMSFDLQAAMIVGTSSSTKIK